MKTVQQIMEEGNAQANIQNFRYMQENYTYDQKVRHAENVAASFEEQCRAQGLNCHVSVGGLDSITLHYFLEECGMRCGIIARQIVEKVTTGILLCGNSIVELEKEIDNFAELIGGTAGGKGPQAGQNAHLV